MITFVVDSLMRPGRHFLHSKTLEGMGRNSSLSLTLERTNVCEGGARGEDLLADFDLIFKE